MSNTGAKRHTHRYHKIGNRWHCSLSDCTHFWPQAGNEALIGKKSKCWDCGREFILDENSLALDRPVCQSCNKNEQPVNALEEYFKEKGI